MRETRVLLLFFLCSSGNSAYLPDLVTNLPGYNGQLNYSQYSGYLNGSLDGNLQLHYWFVTSQSDPDNDPLLFWVNGGPGCSAEDGMLNEHGPLKVNEGGTGLYWNEWAWNRIANVIYLDSPACVGYSYAKDGNCTVDDALATNENYLALLHFLEKFPEYEGRDLFLSSESYGGVYIPFLALKIMRSDSVLQSMLKGIAIGNGVLSSSNNTNTQVTFAYTHGIFSTDLYNSLLENCDCEGYPLQCPFMSYTSDSCYPLLKKAWDNIYSKNLNIYDVVNTCPPPGHQTVSEGDKRKYWLRREVSVQPLRTKGLNQLADKLTIEGDIPYCVDSNRATVYLNQPDVKDALHVSTEAPDWVICAQLPYKIIEHDMFHEVYEIVSRGVRTLIFNGDVDGDCNFIGGEFFARNLGFPSTSDYTEWFTPDGQIGGWWKSFGDNLHFTTVRGAGHSVPEYRPMAAYVMWESFVNNQYKT